MREVINAKRFVAALPSSLRVATRDLRKVSDMITETCSQSNIVFNKECTIDELKKIDIQGTLMILHTSQRGMDTQLRLSAMIERLKPAVIDSEDDFI